MRDTGQSVIQEIYRGVKNNTTYSTFEYCLFSEIFKTQNEVITQAEGEHELILLLLHVSDQLHSNKTVQNNLSKFLQQVVDINNGPLNKPTAK